MFLDSLERGDPPLSNEPKNTVKLGMNAKSYSRKSEEWSLNYETHFRRIRGIAQKETLGEVLCEETYPVAISRWQITGGSCLPIPPICQVGSRTVSQAMLTLIFEGSYCYIKTGKKSRVNPSEPSRKSHKSVCGVFIWFYTAFMVVRMRSLDASFENDSVGQPLV